MKRETEKKAKTEAPEGSRDPASPTGLKAYVLIQTVPGRLEGVARALRRMPAIHVVDAVAGPYDIVVTLEVAEIKDFSHLVAGSIGGLKGVTRTTTLICT